MENWTWGLSLIALTIITHATGVAFMTILARRVRDRLHCEGARWLLGSCWNGAGE
jgi:hypothetical protein